MHDTQHADTAHTNISEHKRHKIDKRKTIDEKLLWAFAVDATKPVRDKPSRGKRLTIPKYRLHRYYVTVCSPKLKEFGVRAGMRYDEAKRLVPDMKVFVYNR